MKAPGSTISGDILRIASGIPIHLRLACIVRTHRSRTFGFVYTERKIQLLETSICMKVRDVFELILLGAIWGGSFLFMRLARKDFEPIPLIELRVLLGGLFLVILLAWSGRLGRLRHKAHWIALVGLLNSAIPFCLFAYATNWMPASYASVLNATAPLFGAIIGFAWLGEKLTPRKILGLAVGFGGVVVLVSGKPVAEGANELAVIAGLAAAFLYGLAAHVTRRYLTDEEPMVIASGSLIAASVILLPGALSRTPSKMPSWDIWLVVLSLGVLCTGIAYAIYFRLLQRVGSAQSMTVAYLIPLFGVLWGYLFLGEEVRSTMLVGGILILLGVYTIVKPSRTPAIKKAA